MVTYFFTIKNETVWWTVSFFYYFDCSRMVRRRVVSVSGDGSVMLALIKQAPAIFVGSKKGSVSNVMPPIAKTGIWHA